VVAVPAPTRTRAPALPVEERRAAIVKAALPLFLEQGSAVKTRDIADAAGIAEGTIFRVFSDKEELIDAVVAAALDHAPLEAALSRIDHSLPFETQLVKATEILRRRVEYVFRVYSAADKGSEARRPRTLRRQPTEVRELVAIFEPEAEHLRVTPSRAAELLRALTFSGTHPAFVIGKPLTSREIVSFLLDGIQAPGRGDGSC
jgi:AcrR family transcriptional regulator